jgi:hypothetical protein
VGGALADAVDRRSLLLASQLLTALCAAGLAVNATVGTALWPLFVLPAAAAGCSVAGESGLSAILRCHRVRGLWGPGVHRRRPDPGPPAPGVQPPGDIKRR